jgi:hypothetical protein
MWNGHFTVDSLSILNFANVKVINADAPCNKKWEHRADDVSGGNKEYRIVEKQSDPMWPKTSQYEKTGM